MVGIKGMVTSVTSSVVEKQKLQITKKSLKSSKRRHNLIPLFKALLMSVGSMPNSKI
jgi:hypothetical protein